MVQGERRRMRLRNSDGSPFFEVPGNAGPRAMDYEALFDAATYQLGSGASVFAGTTDDAFWIDLGATFDTANFRTLGTGIRDARLFYHAGQIATARGDDTEAERLLHLSLASNPHADVAHDVHKALNGLAERYSCLSSSRQ